jgi:glycosyltransferase involved in cell wall biosynthesis
MLHNPAGVLTSLAHDAGDRKHETVLAYSAARIKVVLMDLWCYIPYYDRYLCESLMGEDIEVTLGCVCPYQDPEYFVRNHLFNDPGLFDVVPRLRIHNDTFRRALMLVESCINMMAFLVRFVGSKPEILHVQWIPLVRRFPFEIWFVLLAKKLGIKLVYTVHNVLPHDTGKQLVPVYRRVYGEMDALICHTDEAKTRLVREFSIDPKRVWVIPHGPLLHDAKRSSARASKAALSISPAETLVLCQGIIRPYKGLDFLLESWRQIDPRSLNARLVIAGTGEPGLLQAIKDRVAQLGLHESVRLDLRFIPDEELPTYYQASDILVYPYREVTASGALMTGLAYQKAILATNLPAFQEVLHDKKTALLVDYGDVEAFASSLRSLIRNPKERERLASGVASSNGLNSWSLIAKKTRECYVSVLEQASRETIS